MHDTLYSQVMGLITRIQNYPDVEGLIVVKKKVQQIFADHKMNVSHSIELFLEAYSHDRKGDLDAAVEIYKECLEHIKQDDIQLRVYISGLLASIYTEQGKYSLAHQYYEIVLTSIHLVDDNIRSLIYCNISDMYLCIERYEESIPYALMGVEAAAKSNRHSDYAICYLNLCYSYGKTAQYDKAKSAALEARHFGEIKNHIRITGLSFSYLARVLVIENKQSQSDIISQFESAEHRFQRCIAEHDQLENLIYFAQYLEMIGRDDDALLVSNRIDADFNITTHTNFFYIHATTKANLYRKAGNLNSLIEIQHQHITVAEKAISDLEKYQSNNVQRSVDMLYEDQHKNAILAMQLHMGAITEIGQFIATATDLDSSLPFIFERINTILPTYEFGIALYDQDLQRLNYRYYVNAYGLVEPMEIDLMTSQSVGKYVVKNKTTVHLNSVNDQVLSTYIDNDLSKETNFTILDGQQDTNSILLTPIILDHEVLGLLSVQHTQANQYHQHHRNLMEYLASFIAVSLNNQKHRQRLERANIALAHLSETDPLTGLYNRYQLDKLVPSLMENHITRQTNPKNPKTDGTSSVSLTALMIDVDEYKSYNDVHGHLKGDDALILISGLMRRAFSNDNDHLFRYGGDEFLVLCVDQSESTVESKVRALIGLLYDENVPNPKSRYSDRLSLSIGGASINDCYHCNERSFEQLLDIADEQLYIVKDNGRNDCLFATVNQVKFDRT